MATPYTVDAARNYWRFAPSGKGKVDTGDLLGLDDATFHARWDEHFQSRLHHYWEDGHLVPYFTSLFRGKRVLSFGSGIGHNEIQFLRAGALLTCADIVPTNLGVIERIARLEGLRVNTLLIKEPGATDYGGPYDYVFVRGSLMTVPYETQRREMAAFKRALTADGMIILNLYTWDFVAQTCGVDDPIAFALRSDPSVGSVHNPWSDWHDDAKMQDLAGTDMAISNRQLWNQGLYVWYGLSRSNRWDGAVRPFVDLDRLPLPAAHVALDLTEFDLCEAERLGEGPELALRTFANEGLYAAMSSPISRPNLMPPLSVMLDAELQEGGFAVSILDTEKQRMAVSRSITWVGRRRHYIRLSEHLPETFRIVLSNFRPGVPATSRFAVHALAFVPEA